MKKPILMLFALLLLGGLAPLFPCDITMKTSPVATGDRNKIQVKLFVESIHRRCPVLIEKTKLFTDGVVIEKQSQWKQVETGIYQMDLIVSLKGKDKGEIHVRRECPKTGHQEEILEIDPL